jgi:type I restriction enzyme, R subunit
VVRFCGWQQTIAGEGEVKQALRKTLLKYKLHQEQDLFGRATPPSRSTLEAARL